MKGSNEETVQVTVQFYETRNSKSDLKLTRTVPVQSGSPVIWVYGRLMSFCRDLMSCLKATDPDMTFQMLGQEVFWWTPVEQPAVLRVFHQAG